MKDANTLGILMKANTLRIIGRLTCPRLLTNTLGIIMKANTLRVVKDASTLRIL